MSQSRVLRTERFLLHCWEDGCVVFARSSGDTHVLDVFSASIFLDELGMAREFSGPLRFPSGMTPKQMEEARDSAKDSLRKAGLSSSVS